MTGFKDWSSGENPSALEFDGLIQSQVVGIYTDATDRDTQIGVNTTFGMRAVTMDDRVEWVFEDDGASGVWTEFGRFGEWNTSHVPTLDATTTPPTIGTGPVLECRWTKEGTLATVAYFVKFGSSGSAPGTGIYELDLPPECPAAAAWYGAEEYVAGNGIAQDSSSSTTKTVAVKIVGATTIRLEADGLTGPVTESNLIAWGDSDVVLSGTITYEVAEVTP